MIIVRNVPKGQSITWHALKDSKEEVIVTSSVVHSLPIVSNHRTLETCHPNLTRETPRTNLEVVPYG